MAKDSGPDKFIDEQSLLESAETERYRPTAESYGDYLKVEENRTVGPEEREDLLQSHVNIFVSTYQHQRARTELEPFAVNWLTITHEQVISLKQAIESATREEDLQSYLTENKQFLIQYLVALRTLKKY